MSLKMHFLHTHLNFILSWMHKVRWEVASDYMYWNWCIIQPKHVEWLLSTRRRRRNEKIKNYRTFCYLLHRNIYLFLRGHVNKKNFIFLKKLFLIIYVTSCNKEKYLLVLEWWSSSWIFHYHRVTLLL